MSETQTVTREPFSLEQARALLAKDGPLALVQLFPTLGVFPGDLLRVQAIHLGRGFATIGAVERHKAKIQIADPALSERHLEIHKVDGAGFVLTDTSKNGTWLNGRRTTKDLAAPLQHGDLIQVGNAVLWFGARICGVDAAGILIDAPPQSDGFAVLQGPCPPWNTYDPFYRSLGELPKSPLPRILLTGETGTGKTALARTLHQLMQRPGDLIHISCANIPENLFEATLFGARKGSFTDAREDIVGLLDQADSGTLFLDEIGEMPLTIQAKFLTFLDNGEYRRVGEKQVRQVRAAVVAATNRSLEGAIVHQGFRQDLYYRLCHIKLHLPPLKHRRADIVAAMAKGIKVEHFTADLTARWLLHDWPGNFRELEQHMASLMRTGVDPIIVQHVEHDPLLSAVSSPCSARSATVGNAPPMGRGELAVTLVRHRLDPKLTVAELGIDEPTLAQWLAYHDFQVNDLMVHNFRKHEQLKDEVLNTLGSKRAVAELFGVPDAYNWYRKR